MDSSFITNLILASVRMATPLIFLSLAELYSQRAGLVHIGLEGLAAVVELLDACEGGCGVDAFFCEFPDRKLPVVAQLL